MRQCTVLSIPIRLLLGVAFGIAAAVVAAGPSQAPNQPPAGIRLERIVNGADVGRIVGLAFPGDGTDRLFLVQLSGEIRVVENGQLLPDLFLDVSKKITCCDNERGLLGLAFHPDYENNGYFYIVYSDRRSRTVVARLSVSQDPNVGDPSSEERIIRWDQPELPHNGGAIQFGPDGYLYLGSGDGGTRDAAADLENVLGAILRLDVDSAFPYAIPVDNPFVGNTEARGEIWVYGLRNPWRFTFDRGTGDIFIGDVGAARFEEVSLLPAGTGGGENFGWPTLEGNRCIAGEDEPVCDNEDLVAPIIVYAHKEGTCNSVTGGYRYRGPETPTLTDTYVYGDFCRGNIWGARRNLAGKWIVNELLQSGLLVTTFAEDPDGALYLAHFRGDVYKIVGQHLFSSDFESGDTRDWTKRRGDIEVADRGLKRSQHALSIPIGGRKSFVRSKAPSAETTFRLGFDLNLNDVNLAGREPEILRLAGGSKRGHLRLTLSRVDDDYWLNLLVRGDTGGFFQVGRTILPRARTVRIELDWMAASGEGAADGEVTLSKNGQARISAANLDTAKRKIGSITIGPSSSTAGSGAVLIDNFVSSP
ncbi:MAG: PQQ-dependent sugar dehydrogenase [Thermoanaerobaculia bacterium]